MTQQPDTATAGDLPWMVSAMKQSDKTAVVELARRRAQLGLDHSLVGTIRAAVALAATASDDDLRRGEL